MFPKVNLIALLPLLWPSARAYLLIHDDGEVIETADVPPHYQDFAGLVEHSVQLKDIGGEPYEPWRDDDYGHKVTFPDVIVTLLSEANCKGAADPKIGLNCDAKCWPISGTPKSVLLQARHKKEGNLGVGYFDRFPRPSIRKGKARPKGPDDKYEKVDSRGPEVTFYSRDGDGYICKDDNQLERLVIPQGFSSACFNLDPEMVEKAVGFTARHLQICPYWTKLMKKLYWFAEPGKYTDPDAWPWTHPDLHPSPPPINWYKMDPADVPEWAKKEFDIPVDWKAPDNQAKPVNHPFDPFDGADDDDLDKTPKFGPGYGKDTAGRVVKDDPDLWRGGRRGRQGRGRMDSWNNTHH